MVGSRGTPRGSSCLCWFVVIVSVAALTCAWALLIPMANGSCDVASSAVVTVMAAGDILTILGNGEADA